MLRSTAAAIAMCAVLTVPAFAGEQASGIQPQQVAAVIQANAAMVQKTQSSAIEAYNANVNPLAFMLEKVGP